MKVLVTGHDGYIGTVLTPRLQAAGHDPVGLDAGLFANHAFAAVPEIPAREADVRDVTAEELDGFDAVVNNLVAYAHATGEVRMQSDGTPWRPLAHVQDIADAFIAALEAPREAIHNEAFNVGRDEDNHQISDLARMVGDATGAEVTLAPGAGPDTRSYRVDFAKARRLFAPQWTVRRGIEEIHAADAEQNLTLEQFLSPRFQRLARLRELVEAGELGAELRRRVRA